MSRKKVMKKMVVLLKSVLLFIGIGVLLYSVSWAATPNKTRKYAVSLRGGLATISKMNYGSDLVVGLGVLFKTSEKIGLEITIDRYSIPVSEDLGGLDQGSLNVTPFLLSGQWRFPSGRFEPYAALGVGFYFFNHVPELASPVSIKEYEVADRFALHLGGGVDVKATRSVDIFGDLRFSLIKTWIQPHDAHFVKPEEQDIFHLDTLVITIGVKFYF